MGHVTSGFCIFTNIFRFLFTNTGRIRTTVNYELELSLKHARIKKEFYTIYVMTDDDKIVINFTFTYRSA